MKDLRKELHFSKTDSTSVADIRKLAIQLLNENWTINSGGVTLKGFNLVERGWRFEFNNKRASLGTCSRRRKTIYVSLWFLEQHLDKAWRFENTIRHEIAHAIDSEIRGTSDHSNPWKRIAMQVLSIPERCVPLGGEATNKKTSKYTLICDNCGKETARHKKITRLKHACGVCCDAHNNGRYAEKFVLRLVQNY